MYGFSSQYIDHITPKLTLITRWLLFGLAVDPLRSLVLPFWPEVCDGEAVADQPPEKPVTPRIDGERLASMSAAKMSLGLVPRLALLTPVCGSSAPTLFEDISGNFNDPWLFGWEVDKTWVDAGMGAGGFGFGIELSQTRGLASPSPTFWAK